MPKLSRYRRALACSYMLRFGSSLCHLLCSGVHNCGARANTVTVLQSLLYSALQEARKKMEAEEKREIERLNEHLANERVSSRPLST